jgi:hypothetical protein
MAAPKGNKFWRARSKHGRDKIFATPEDLWAACEEFFDWIEANPLIEAKPFCYEGVAFNHEVPRMRAMTIDGLCLFLGVGTSTWFDYRKRKDFSEVITRAESVIFNQKFTGAAADLLNSNIIARDLGLTDKREVTETKFKVTAKNSDS